MENKHTSDLIGQRDQRIKKESELTSLGIDTYPSKAERTVVNDEILKDYASLEDKEVIVAGRILTWRKHGELNFIDLQDDTGRIQLYLKINEIDPTDPSNQSIGPEHFNLLDLGDHIQAKGTVTKTKTGQESVLVSEIKLLSKSIRPLPNKWGAMTDKEARFRRRYLDMTMNPEIRERFKRRAIYWQAVRDFMNDNGFYEVNIPVLEHTTGGADAKPFITHYDALDEDFYLRISHELPLKRLLGAGFEKVYDLGPRFRNEGFSDEHLPEHIAMEWYWAYADWRDGMEFTKELFKFSLQKTYGTLKFKTDQFEIDLDDEWVEYDFADIIKEKFDVDIFDDSLEKLADVLVNNSDIRKDDIVLNRSRLSDSLWKLIRPTIGGPVFLTGVPKFLSPLSKTSKEDPRKTERFHPIILGSELANAFTELNDPQDQLNRFVEQQKMRESGDDEAHMLDIDFVEMLEYGMPPAVGYGMSERVFWMFENVSAREGVPFPPLRRGLEETTKEIYAEILPLIESTAATSVVENEDPKVSADKDLKIVMVLDKEMEGWRITNTVGHISAMLGSKVGNNLQGRDSFKIVERELPANAYFPIVALSGTQTQLHNLSDKLEDLSNVKFIIYTEEMIDNLSDDDVQAVLEEKELKDITIMGVGILGSKKDLDNLTKKFSLWK